MGISKEIPQAKSIPLHAIVYSIQQLQEKNPPDQQTHSLPAMLEQSSS